MALKSGVAPVSASGAASAAPQPSVTASDRLFLALRRALLAVIFSLTAIWAVAMLAVDSMHREVLEAGRQRVQHVAQAFAETLAGHLSVADGVLDELQEEWQAHGPRGMPDELRREFTAQAVTFAGLQWVDQTGVLKGEYPGQVPGRIFMPKKVLDSVLDSGAPEKTAVSMPATGASAELALVAARPINNRDGRRAGAVIAGLSGARMTAFLRHINIGSDLKLTAMTATGSVVFVVEGDTVRTARPREIPKSLLAQVQLQKQGALEVDPEPDREGRVFGFSTLNNAQLVVVADKSTREVLADARKQGVNIFLIAALISLLVGSGALLAYRLTGRLQTANDGQQKSEQRFRNFATAAADWYWETDAAHRLIFISHGLSVSKSSDYGLGRPFPEFVGAAIDAGGREVLEEALAKQSAFRDLERRWANADGTEECFHLSADPVTDAQGRFAGFCGVGRDITEQYQLSRRLQLQHRIARLLADDASIDETMPKILQVICMTMGWQLGSHVLVQKEERVARYPHFWVHPRFSQTRFARMHDDESRPLIPGGLIHDAARTQMPQWCDDLIRRNILGERQTAAREAGMRGRLVIPIMVGGALSGVLDFYYVYRLQPDDKLVEIMVSLGRDVSRFIEKKNVEKALRDSEERYSTLFHDNPVPMIVHDASTGLIRVANAAAQRLLKNSEDKLVFLTVQQLVADIPAPAVYQRLCQASEFDPLRVRLVAPDEATLEVDLYSQPFPYSGQPMRLLIIEDVSARERANRARMESDRQLQLALRGAQLGVWSWSVASNTVHVQGFLPFAIETEASELPLVQVLEHIDARDRDRVSGVLRNLAAGVVNSVASSFRLAGGPEGFAQTWLHAQAEVVEKSDAGLPLRVVILVSDISARKDAEAVLQAYAREREALSKRLLEAEEAERGELSRELHDRVGQDLTAIHLNMDMIGHLLPEGTRQSVKDKLEDTRGLLRSAIRHVRNLMADLRPEGLHDFGLGAALQAYAVRMAERSGLVIEVQGEIQGEIQSEIQGEMQGKMQGEAGGRLSTTEEVALFRIVQEALHNAIKHAHGKRVEIGWDAQKRELHVRDDGSGFDPGREGMSGYGLRVMRERAQAVGADLAVDSAPGKGTCVRVRLLAAHRGTV